MRLPGRRGIDVLLQIAFGVVAVVAGIVGVVMLIAPDTTDDYFAWALGPPPLASLVGGFYVASTLVFGAAIRRGWGEVRPLVAGVLALTLPTLTATLIHTEVFDFSRPVAVIWLLLFIGSPATYGSILVIRRGDAVAPGSPLPRAARVALGALALALVVFGVLCWVDRGAAADLTPFALPPMGAKFLGAWAAFLAVLAAWPAARGGWNEARIPLLGLSAYALGGVGAGLRSLSDLTPTDRRVGYLLALAALASAAAALLARAPRAAPQHDKEAAHARP